MATLPNLLSLLRIALIPFLVYFLTDTGPLSSLLAAFTFFIASLTDLLDGYLARLHGHTTTLGQLLDPLADKLVVAAEELGKYKMIFQMFALHGLLIHYPYGNVDFHLAGMYFLWISLVLGVWSGIDYHVKVIRQVNARHAPADSHVPRSAGRVEARG